MVNMLLQNEESEWVDDESESCNIQLNGSESGDLYHWKNQYVLKLKRCLYLACIRL